MVGLFLLVTATAAFDMEYAGAKPPYVINSALSQDQGTQPQENNWFCIPDGGFGRSYRLDAQGDVQCASADFKNCDGGCSSRVPGSVTPVSPMSSTHPLTCGVTHKVKWGTTGYSDSRHWCSTMREVLKPSGDWITGLTAFQFSTNKHGGPAKVLDGDSDSCYFSEQMAHRDLYLRIDLGRSYSVNQIAFQLSYSIAPFQFYFGNDRDSYRANELVGDFSRIQGLQWFRADMKTAKQGRYVFLVSPFRYREHLGGRRLTGFHVCSVSVRDAATNAAIPLSGMSASGNSISYDFGEQHQASRAVDGDSGTCSMTGNHDTGGLYVDLGAVYDITKIQYVIGEGVALNIEVDNAVFRPTKQTQKQITSAPVLQQFDLEGNIRGRRLRLRLPPQYFARVRVCEVRVQGKKVVTVEDTLMDLLNEF